MNDQPTRTQLHSLLQAVALLASEAPEEQGICQMNIDLQTGTLSLVLDGVYTDEDEECMMSWLGDVIPMGVQRASFTVNGYVTTLVLNYCEV